MHAIEKLLAAKSQREEVHAGEIMWESIISTTKP